jgi:hypothetical protein
MCRSSTYSIGFLLLLWIGLVLPTTEQQLLHFADDQSSKVLFDRDSGPVPAAGGDDEPRLVDSDDKSPNGATPDLPDITAAGSMPRVAGADVSSRPVIVNSTFISRTPLPQERPPKALAA